MTDNTQELEEILEGVANEYSAGGNYENAKPLMVEEAEQAILDWHNKQIAKARIEELKQLEALHTRTYRQTVTDHMGNIYVDDSRSYISKYETQERIATLEAELSKTLKEHKN